MAALGPCLSRTGAGRGGRGSMLDVLWKREEPGCKSPQKRLFQLWWPTSAPITSKEQLPSLLGGSQPPAPRPCLGKEHRAACGVVGCGRKTREGETTRLGRQAMSGGRVCYITFSSLMDLSSCLLNSLVRGWWARLVFSSRYPGPCTRTHSDRHHLLRLVG